MIKSIFITGFALALITACIWNELKRSNRITKWLTFILFGVSGILWVYVSTMIHIPRPVEWLEYIFKPFNPINKGG